MQNPLLFEKLSPKSNASKDAYIDPGRVIAVDDCELEVTYIDEGVVCTRSLIGTRIYLEDGHVIDVKGHADETLNRFMNGE